jgi:predicted Fe-Mo cluster-binding NifX family protein/DNA-binding PadR family transcriptional regulator
MRFLQSCLLVLLHKSPGYGYSLAVDLGRFGLGQESVDIRIVYRALRNLEDESLVMGTWDENSLGPQRRMYAITPSGEAALADWMKGLLARKMEIEELEKAFLEVGPLAADRAEAKQVDRENTNSRRDIMKIAVTAESENGLDSLVAHHFGHTPYFVLVEVENQTIASVKSIANPFAQAHAPGDIPSFVKSQGITTVLSGGMGSRAIDLFAQFGIKAATGADGTVRQAVENYLGGKLAEAAPCSDSSDHDHSHEHGHNCH